MLLEDVTQVLDALDEAGVSHWVGGGWGVAALVGRQTREHRDLDLAVNMDDLPTCIQTLSNLGYRTETDWLPVRIELSASGDRWVDVHPVRMDDDGNGRQSGLDGVFFDYPRSGFTSGVLDNRRINCLSAQQQRVFRSGYEHQSKDVHDLAQLDSLEAPTDIPETFVVGPNTLHQRAVDRAEDLGQAMDIPETLDAGPIRLQRWTVDRADDLDKAINESLPELMAFMPWATADHDLADTNRFLTQSQREWDNGENFNYGMLTSEGHVVGACGLMSRQGPGVLEIGYWVHSAHAGKGYATAAVSALTDVGLVQPGINRVEIHHDVDNPASGRVAAKSGFQQSVLVEVERKASRDSGTNLVWTRRNPQPAGPSRLLGGGEATTRHTLSS